MSEGKVKIEALRSILLPLSGIAGDIAPGSIVEVEKDAVARLVANGAAKVSTAPVSTEKELHEFRAKRAKVQAETEKARLAAIKAANS
jgi:hypothetical protein